MQTGKEKQTLNELNKHLSGFDLTTLLIRGGIGKLSLNTNARLVLLYMAACYNERNGNVFPRVGTMSEALGISERGVIRALAELTEKGCILKAKKGKNANVYVITNKVLNIGHGDITSGHSVIMSSDTMSPPCIEVKQQEVKETTNKEETPKEPESKKVVAFSSFKQRRNSVRLEDVPAIIRNNPKIKNPCAYFAALSDEVKAEYIQRQAEADEQAERIRQAKAEEERKKIAEKRELEELRKQKDLPLNERFTKEQAESILNKMPAMLKNQSQFARDLSVAFNIEL